MYCSPVFLIARTKSADPATAERFAVSRRNPSNLIKIKAGVAKLIQGEMFSI